MDRLFEKEKPLRVAVLFSGNAGSARFVEKNAGKKIEIVCALTDKKIARGILPLKKPGIPVIALDFKEFCASRGLKPRDLAGRKAYFESVLKELKPFNPDVIMLSGFMKIITEPLLSAFENKIINVHPADLTIKENGRPKFRGGNAVEDAVKAGENTVRSSVHIVSREVDCGPVLVLSKPVPVQDSAEKTQEKLKREGDDPAFLKALELIADGKVSVEKGRAFIAGKAGPVALG